MGFKSVTRTQTHMLIICNIFLTGNTSSSAQRTGKVNCVGVVQLVFVTQISGVMHTIRHKKRRMNWSLNGILHIRGCVRTYFCDIHEGIWM